MTNGSDYVTCAWHDEVVLFGQVYWVAPGNMILFVGDA
jgi:hypothetical protein